MALNVPDRNQVAIAFSEGNQEVIDRALAFFQAAAPHIDSEDSLRAVIDRGSQYNDFVREAERGIEMFFAQNAGREIGQFQNFASGLGEREDIDEAAVARARQLHADNIANNDYESQVNFLRGFADAGVLEPDTVDRMNSIIQIVSDEFGELNPTLRQVSSIEGGTGAEALTAQDLVDQVTGASGSTSGLQEEEPDRREPGRPSRRDFDPSPEGTEQFAQALNEFIGRDISRPGEQPIEGAVGGVDGTPETEAGEAPGGAAQAEVQTGLQDALDIIESADLPPDIKALYRTVVQNWDPNQELNPQAVIDEFNKIKESTIDPHFQGLANIAIEQVNSAVSSLTGAREREVETEAVQAQEQLRAAKGGLEASGLTSSGEALRQLGGESALAQEKIPFGGADIEGLLPKQQRLISTSSEARFQENLKNLGLQAEQTFGSERAAGLVPGTELVGSVTGALPQQQQQAEAGTLSGILGQQRQTKAQNELLNF